MKQYILQLYKRNLVNPIQTGLIESVEGDSLIEICSKVPLLMINIQQREHEKELLELSRKVVDDDIPF